MVISLTLFFASLLIFIAVWVMKVRKNKLNGKFKRVLKIINLIALILTMILISLWFFNWHLYNLTIEIIPFWIFIATSLMLFGLTDTSRTEKIIYGLIFYLHLFLTFVLVIPYIGTGITLSVYSSFIPENILYEDKEKILTEEFTGLLAPKPSPVVYIKCGPLMQKFRTNLSPVYSVDKVSLKKIDNSRVELDVHADQEYPGMHTRQILFCNCL